ncbi:hypothetical protein [Anaerosporobacter faecicola]|uniref:hypothetical protein n=1 Tax=Anaerosporobacter faecicola TaxID=2718714 RepID=UPI0014392726|nr:hypothetical protein [Anaerosporobacter faecicola]
MKGIKQLIRNEMDVEFFGSVHGLCQIFMFGFLEWLNHVNNIPYSYIVQMWIVGYLIAWFQKGLFLSQKVYRKGVYQICTVLWNVGPVLIMLLAQQVFGWFAAAPKWEFITYHVIMLFYFPIMWLCLEVFYKEDTKELNILLKKYKEESNE